MCKKLFTENQRVINLGEKKIVKVLLNRKNGLIFTL